MNSEKVKEIKKVLECIVNANAPKNGMQKHTGELRQNSKYERN